MKDVWSEYETRWWPEKLTDAATSAGR
jgi:hypothetical protein